MLRDRQLLRPDVRPTDNRRWVRPLIPWAVLACLLVIILVMNPAVAQVESMQSSLTQAAPVLILAVGLTPTILIGGLDLSIAALASLASILLALWTPSLGWLGVGLVLLACVACGACVGFIQGYAQIPSFIVTLGALGVYGGIALVVSDATNLPLGEGQRAIEWLNIAQFNVPMTFAVALGTVVVVGLVLARTVSGRSVYAIGASEPAAILSGIRPLLTRVAVYGFAGACAALAALFLVSKTSYASPTLANLYLLPAIAAVFIGGTSISGGVGSVWQSLCGALIVIVVQTGLIVVGIEPTVSNFVFGVVIIVSVAFTTNRRLIGVVK